MHLIHLSEELLTRALSGREPLPAAILPASVVAVGSFDGLHPGHMALIEAVKREAADRGLASCLFTFRSHPRAVLDGRAPRQITSWREKLALLSGAGLDAVTAVDFCPALARLDYREFVDRFLRAMLGMRHLVGGHDLHLGAGRGGTAATLAAYGEACGYTMEIVPARTLPDGRLVSSSAIRALVAAGEVADAAVMLGRPYTLWGEVGHGDGRGAGLGYPTANLRPLDPEKVLPEPGVYAVRAHVPLDAVEAPDRDGALAVYEGALPETDRDGVLRGTLDTARAVFAGMLNHGRAPTVHAGGLPEPRLEVHILDFSGYIRERSLKIEWVDRLRAERTFADVDALRAQLARDEVRVRELIPRTEDAS